MTGSEQFGVAAVSAGQVGHAAAAAASSMRIAQHPTKMHFWQEDDILVSTSRNYHLYPSNDNSPPNYNHLCRQFGEPSNLIFRKSWAFGPTGSRGETLALLRAI